MDFPRLRSGFLWPCLVLGGSLAAGGAALGAPGWVASLGGLAAGLGLGAVRSGIEISPDLRRSREYLALAGWRVGAWQPLAPVVGVTLKYYSTLEKAATSSTTHWGVWNDAQRRREELIVMLSLQHSATGLIVAHFGLDDVNVAIDFAHDTAARFDVPVNQYLPSHMFQPLPLALGSKSKA